MNSNKEAKKNWAFWIDRGGTFTDIIARAPDGQLHAVKKLSESVRHTDPIFSAIKELLESRQASFENLESIRMGTTIGTNALLERQGARTVFVCTKGFADAISIAYQNRPEIFALEIKLPEMIYEEVIEFDERIDSQGRLLRKPDLESLAIELRKSYERGIRSCAIALMHAYKYPEHELQAAEIARETGFSQISVSHECAALAKYISRSDTTLVDAYLTPLLKDYIGKLKNRLGETSLEFMQSNGGLADAAIFRGKDCILSGPAGGLVGAMKAAKDCGFDNIISFDMGGTSTDVAHLEAEIEHVYDSEIAGMRIRAPMIDIHTVAAGGGSILRFDGSRLRVGPESAGAIPGPLSYRRHGPLALTDANLLTGRIKTEFFPKVFGAEENQTLDYDSVKKAFASLADEISKESGFEESPEDLALGFIKIAVNKMANAIKHVSVQRGHDPRKCLLVCFGGAGGQHACQIAEELGIEKILIHPLAGLLSAFGIGLAESRLSRELEINTALASINKAELDTKISAIETELSLLMDPENQFASKELIANALVKMSGSDYAIPVKYSNGQEMSTEFLSKHLSRYGFVDSKRELILAELQLQLLGKHMKESELKMPLQAASETGAKTGAEIVAEIEGGHKASKLYCAHKDERGGRWLDCRLIERQAISKGMIVKGPAIITEAHSTTIVEPGWQASMLENTSLILSKLKKDNSEKEESFAVEESSEKEESAKNKQSAKAEVSLPKAGQSLPANKVTERPDPVTLELFNNLFSFVAEQMGITLQNTSQSVNIKERLDFSCAIFDKQGNLVANAPHIPVHLGSMGESVKSLIERKSKSMKAGDAYASNNPYDGGTHLPDITVISPHFYQGELLFFVASRGHHADIGGISPGSMPAESSSIEEEGILFDHMLLMCDQKILEAEILEHLSLGKYPARNPAYNLGDLKAQVAANSQGIKQLEDLMSKWSRNTVLQYMGFVQDNAEECVRRAIKSLNSGSFTCILDDGNLINVNIEIDRKNLSAHIDFTGSSPQSKDNFNAPLAVCKAAVLYVFRTLVRDQIPLNAGCFRPLKLTVPKGSLLNPEYPAPVVAGNVETSQVIVDALYGAMGIMAAAQGSMNNLSFGNQSYQYYETIAGGTGASASFSGTGPVQSHMTNSRLTDPEVLELRFPVILESFCRRLNSGGPGKYRGGDGAVRKLRFLQNMKGSIISNRRSVSPHGLAGGSAGTPGRNYISRNGIEEELSYRASFRLEPGDILTIETPGGGGYGQE